MSGSPYEKRLIPTTALAKKWVKRKVVADTANKTANAWLRKAW